MRKITAVFCLAGLFLFSGCQSEEKKGIDLAALLKDAPEGSFIEGVASGVGEPEIINNKDFVYAVNFSGDGNNMAWVHHVATHMEISLGALGPESPRYSGKPRFRVQGNVSEFDIEDILFAKGKDGADSTLIFPSRQGIVRKLSSTDGRLLQDMTLGVPLVRVALNPSATLLAVGSTTGEITLFDLKDLSVRGSAQLHTDVLQALAFVDDTHLLSGGFDRELVLSEVKLDAPKQAILLASSLPTGEQVFIAHLDGTKALPTVRDGRQPGVVISSTAVKRLMLAPVAGKTLPVRTALGVRTSSVVNLGELRISTLTFGVVEAAICDVCVPIGAELVLGENIMSRAVFLDDVANERVIVQPGKTVKMNVQAMSSLKIEKDTEILNDETAGEVKALEEEGSVSESKAEPSENTEQAKESPAVVLPAVFLKNSLALIEKMRVDAPGFITDLHLDASRKLAVLTYSHGRAERSPDVYDAEKNASLPPPNATSAAVLVDTSDLSFGKRFIGHQGFTVTGTLSPDGKTVATGGWDKHAMVFDVKSGKLLHDEEMAWLVRRMRFSPDGRSLAVATWTPANPFDDNVSEPALLLFPLLYDEAKADSTKQP